MQNRVRSTTPCSPSKSSSPPLYHDDDKKHHRRTALESILRRLLLRIRLLPKETVLLTGSILLLSLVLWIVIQWAGTGEHTASLLRPRKKPARHYPRLIFWSQESQIIQQWDLNLQVYPSKRQMPVSKHTLKALERLKESQEYRRGQAEPFETDDCKAQYDWQLTSRPTCNAIHEHNMADEDIDEDRQVQYLSHGFWRDVWTAVTDLDEVVVLKTIRYVHDYVPKNYDRHRRDAMAMEHLTSSPFVADIYGFCGNSGLFSFSSEGDLEYRIWPDGGEPAMTMEERLVAATQATMGIAAMHNVDQEGRASIASTDITPGQFLFMDGIYKLNDFNRARFIRESRSDPSQVCGYSIPWNPGKNRSPEEYLYEEQSEKVDVYSLGNIFYMLLEEKWPFEDVDEDEAKKLVSAGKRPPMSTETLESTDPVHKALLRAMHMCHIQDPVERKSAREVETYLIDQLNEIYPGSMEKWNPL